MGTPHLAESTLHKENVLAFGHSAVWGSCWEPTQQGNGFGRWGYACCRCWDRCAPCPNAKDTSWTHPTQDHHREGKSIVCGAQKQVEQELQMRETYDGPISGFVRHVVNWLFQRWHKGLVAQAVELVRDPLFCEKAELEKAQVGLKPLLDLLDRVELRQSRAKRKGLQSAPKVITEREDWECPHCKYHNHGERITCRKCKRDDENYIEPDEFPKFEELILQKVGRVMELVAAREYVLATEVFLELTIGHGRWNSDIMALTGSSAPTRKARAAQQHMRRQASEMAPMDSEEGKLYLCALKRLVTLAQLLRPNPEASRNVAR